MKTAYLITPAQASDVQELAALVNSAYRGDSSRAGWTTEADFLDGQRTESKVLLGQIADPMKAVILCLREAPGREVLGCVYLENDGENGCYLGMLTVKPTLQTQGLGSVLMQSAEDQARRWQAKSLTLGVIQVRGSLIRWYERRGYQRTGETRPFPYGQPSVGLPQREDLHFVMFAKTLI